MRLREKSLILLALKQDRRVTAAIVMLIGVIISSCLALNYAVAQDALTNPTSFVSREAHDAVIRSFESQIGTLRWVGIAIITSLVGAVGLLYRALEKANADSRGDLIEGIKRREVILEENMKAMASSNEALHALGENIERLLKKD